MTDGCRNLSGHYHLQPSADCYHGTNTWHVCSLCPGKEKWQRPCFSLLLCEVWACTKHGECQVKGKTETQGMKGPRYDLTVWDKKVVVVWVRILRAQCASWAEGAMDSPVRNLIHSHKFFQFFLFFFSPAVCHYTTSSHLCQNISCCFWYFWTGDMMFYAWKESLRRVHLQTLWDPVNPVNYRFSY